MVLLAAEARWPAVFFSFFLCFFSFSSVSVFFSFLLFFLFSSLFPLPSAVFSLSLVLPSLPLFFPTSFRSPSPVFIGKNRGGGVVVGRPLSAAPPLSNQRIKSRRQVGEMRASYCAKSEKEVQRKVEKKKSSSPLFSACVGKKTMVLFQNSTVLHSPFFYINSA